MLLLLILLTLFLFVLIALKNVWLKKPSQCGEVLVPPQYFIRASKALLKKTSLALPGAPQAADKVLDLLDRVWTLKFSKTEEELLSDYEKIDPLSPQASSSKDQDTSEIEQRFVANVARMLDKANFRPLTEREAEFGLEDEYMITVPLKIFWEKLDDVLLSKFLSSYKGPRPTFSKSSKVLVFHRGVSVDHTTGLLIWEKIDILMQKLMSLVPVLLERLKIRAPSSATTPVVSAYSVLDMTQEPSSQAGTILQQVIKKPSSVAPTKVKRVRLLDTGLDKLLDTVHVQEPAFEELFLLYKPLPGSDSAASLSLHGMAQAEEDTPKTPAAASSSSTAAPAAAEKPKDMHRIFLKAFRNIPMADLEVTFPEVRPQLKPFDMVFMVSTAVFGLSALISELVSAEPGLGRSGWVAIGSGLLFMRLAVSYFTNMAYYQSTVLGAICNRTSATNRAALVQLINSVREQEYKEAALCWAVLAASSEPLDSRQLGVKCEEILASMNRESAIPSAFETDDAIRKGLELKVINLHTSPTSRTTFSAVPPKEAMEILSAALTSF